MTAKDLQSTEMLVRSRTGQPAAIQDTHRVMTTAMLLNQLSSFMFLDKVRINRVVLNAATQPRFAVD